MLVTHVEQQGGSMMRGFFSGLVFLTITAHAAVKTETFYENASGSPIFSLIAAARQSMDIEIYEMNDPLVQTAVKSAVDRGVQVRMIEEAAPVGKSCHVFVAESSQDDAACKTQKGLYHYIIQKKGVYVPFSEKLCGISGSRCYEHGKMILVDSKYAMMSTGNFNTTSLCNQRENPGTCNRDYTMISTDPQVVHSLEAVFDRDLRGSSSYSPGNAIATTAKITVSPYSLSPIVDFIRSAKKSVQIQNQYLQDPDMNQAIMEVARRGVKVFVTVSSVCSYGKPNPTKADKWKAIYSAFDQAGVHTSIFTRQMKINNFPGYLHAKAILVDSSRAWVGSVNGSATSLTNNREFGIFFNTPSEVNKLANFMYQDYTNPNGETWQESLNCKHDPSPSLPEPPADDQDPDEGSGS